jgi:membrane-bound ClpP family serine protease
VSLIILLFALGIIFLAVEVIVPGAVLGSIGALLMLAGCYVAFINFDTLGGVLAVISAFTIGITALFVEFRILPKTKLGKRAFLTSEITAVSAAIGKEALDLVGQSAESLTMLSPSGYVLVNGRRYDAFCQNGQVPAGTQLEIIGADSFRLIVSLPNTN